VGADILSALDATNADTNTNMAPLQAPFRSQPPKSSNQNPLGTS
jgi:hypothetical protein